MRVLDQFDATVLSLTGGNRGRMTRAFRLLKAAEDPCLEAVSSKDSRGSSGGRPGPWRDAFDVGLDVDYGWSAGIECLVQGASEFAVLVYRQSKRAH